MRALDSAVSIPERHAGAVFAAIGIVFALAYGSSLWLLPKPDGRIVIGDALHHYVQLRSAVFDADLHFRNEYVRLYGLRGGEPGTEWVYEPTPTGHVRNLMPVGPAVVWAPGFLLVSFAVWVAGILGNGYPLDGYGRWFQASAGFSGIAAATAGAWLAFRAAASLVTPRAAVWATLAVWLSSSAVYYSVISPTYSHASSMLAVSLFFYVWVKTRDRHDTRRYAWLGITAGFAAMVRWQDATLIALPFLELLWRRRDLGATVIARYGAACAVGAVAAFAPQMIVWTVLYGAPLAIPQGPEFMRWTQPALWAILFSDNHGLLSWTPVLALALAGQIPLARRFPTVGWAALAFVIVSWYVNAAVADWWAGEAFGARRFVSCFPIFVLGLAALFDRWRDRAGPMVAVTAGFVAMTLLLLIQYQAFMHGLRDLVPYPRGFDGLWLARFRAPVDLFRWWLER